jgi:hypothetical protein
MWSWTESEVGREQPHLVLAHDEHVAPVALVGAPADGIFPVQFLVSRESDHEVMRRVVADTVRSLDLYLTEVGRPDPWAYAIYHCRTAANIYQPVHWSYVDPKGS